MSGESPTHAMRAFSSSGQGPLNRSSQTQRHCSALPTPHEAGSSPNAPHKRWHPSRAMQPGSVLPPLAPPAPPAPAAPAMALPPTPGSDAPAAPLAPEAPPAGAAPPEPPDRTPSPICAGRFAPQASTRPSAASHRPERAGKVHVISASRIPVRPLRSHRSRSPFCDRTKQDERQKLPESRPKWRLQAWRKPPY